MKRIILFFSIMTMVFYGVSYSIAQLSYSQEVDSKGIVKKGDVGGYVWQLQGRLKFLGFYKGSVDGKFGWGTYWAVRNFQYQFGLKVDGVVGPSTKNMLWKATKNWNPQAGKTSRSSNTVTYKTDGASSNDIKLMANAVYGEARGEPYVGQVAVAAVILNRVESPAFPNTIPGVIFEPRAFTAVADGQIWLTPNATAKKAVKDALNGWDPSNGAIYYFNPDTATSGWIWSRPQIKRIGRHIFAK